jgi:hypothetical protein
MTGPFVPVRILNLIRAFVGIPHHRFNLFVKCSRCAGIAKTWSAPHSSIVLRPAAVIWRRTASTGLAPAFMVSRSALASPARTSSVVMSLVKPWARTSNASVAPWGLLASSVSSSSTRRGCGLRRRFLVVVISPVSDADIYFQLSSPSPSSPVAQWPPGRPPPRGREAERLVRLHLNPVYDLASEDWLGTGYRGHDFR